jgi:Tfp pilus assembly protein PilO
MREQGPQQELAPFGWILHGIGLAVAFIGAAVFWFALIAPLRAERADCLAEHEGLVVLLDQARRVEQEHQRTAAELQRLKARKALLRQRITDGTREGEFLRQLTEVATAVDVRVREFRPGSVSRRGEYGALRVELSCEGTYASICRFLAQLDALPRLSHVTHLEITAATRGDVYPMKLQLDIFFAEPHVPGTNAPGTPRHA